ncbi:chitin synthase G [Aspergillus luchuensis]|uniref:Chitin synthase G n=1 Tax=Aspergillus kawachii TaxID=1069201 RepID=A0A146FGS6_ASPKA|nr:chitin synthase G [Aspergillus luchuensis]
MELRRRSLEQLIAILQKGNKCEELGFRTLSDERGPIPFAAIASFDPKAGDDPDQRALMMARPSRDKLPMAFRVVLVMYPPGGLTIPPRSADWVLPRSQAAMTVQTAECPALLGED